MDRCHLTLIPLGKGRCRSLHVPYRCHLTLIPLGKGKYAGTAYGSYGVDTNWYTDSGATDHITGELEKLHVRDRYNGNEQIHTASGSGMDKHHIGNSVIHTPPNDLHLNNILHVPQATKSLLSTSRLARDNHAFVEYWPNSFFVKDQDTREVLLNGRFVDGLYPLPSSFTSSFGSHAHGAIKSSSLLWHRHQGHPSSIVVHQVLRDNSIPFSATNKESVCDACQMAKSHQLPYPKSTSVSTSPLELVFSDVWGPASESFGRFKYYVSFIDDYSKFTWVYLLKKKSDVFQKFHDFQNHVERLFDKKILAMQTDWGGEYQKLNSFFQRVGISHLVSCPHAHQQNGPPERKHRHIVEVSLSLLAYASMPLKYWDEAFLTAVYLINRLPSKVIQSKTPMERLFGNSGDYSLLCIFGCACWPNLRPYNRHKLDFRSKQCVFLGYSNLHKGYKFLDISTRRMYISRDVVFDETVFPFSSLHANAGARLRDEINLLPLSLQPLNFHYHEGLELREPIDVNPTNATNSAAESFL
jgi:histone deacetylase 1/2